MTRAERIEAAIVAARQVAASPEAKDLRRRSNGKAGVWTAEDEARLRRGEIAVTLPDGRRDVYRLRDA